MEDQQKPDKPCRATPPWMRGANRIRIEDACWRREAAAETREIPQQLLFSRAKGAYERNTVALDFDEWARDAAQFRA